MKKTPSNNDKQNTTHTKLKIGRSSNMNPTNNKQIYLID